MKLLILLILSAITVALSSSLKDDASDALADSIVSTLDNNGGEVVVESPSSQSSFEVRLSRLERLVVERRDIVEDYNLQQLDDTPMSTLLMNYIWKALKSRPLFRLYRDER